MMVYIASESPLPLIAWNDQCPAFYVTELPRPQDEQVRVQFSKPYVYYVGSHQGCGCGFLYGQYPGFEDDANEERDKRESVARLSQYLAEAVAANGPIELFACWDGDQAIEPEDWGNITPEDIGGEVFYLEELQFLVIGAEAGSNIS
ncbi:MAG: hypothetical protein JXB07_00575 [Anaerolineae bacterium]|nr:hypothetical protein [Anaerolineae bacterium]